MAGDSKGSGDAAANMGVCEVCVCVCMSIPTCKESKPIEMKQERLFMDAVTVWACLNLYVLCVIL